jgi:threonine dehydratase
MTEAEAQRAANEFSVTDVRAAAERIAGRVIETPLLESAELNARTGARVWLKAETLQHTGAFKARGAFNKLLSLSQQERVNGVVAFSSGNHAQAVAYAARALGMRATIVMPSDAPAVKIARTKAFGAEVVTYDREREDRAAIASRIARERGAIIAPPFDDPFVMAGQGTLGLELAAQAKARGAIVDVVLTPASGGGLSGGVATAVRSVFPSAQAYAVEPEGFDDIQRSLKSGQIEKNPRVAGSICDALLVQAPSVFTFGVNRKQLAGAVTVSDAEALRAMRYAFEELKLVVEPSGATALAAVLNKKIAVAGKTVAVVVSGGNVDSAMFARALETN